MDGMWPWPNISPPKSTHCATYAMRILGAYGYSIEYPVARLYRDVPTYTMVEGSANNV